MNDEVRELLAERFVCGWQNIWKQGFVGESRGYDLRQHAVGTTNGAGGRNVQILVLAPDLTVLHVLPGFWHPEDLVRELRFAEGLAMVWRDPALSREQKEAMFASMQRAEPRLQPEETFARSGWQGFDAHAERHRSKTEPRDTLLAEAGEGAPPAMKPLNQLVHERMAMQPFRALADFDLEALIDYGRRYYDNNPLAGDKGVALPRPPRRERSWM